MTDQTASVQQSPKQQNRKKSSQLFVYLPLILAVTVFVIAVILQNSISPGCSVTFDEEEGLTANTSLPVVDKQAQLFPTVNTASLSPLESKNFINDAWGVTFQIPTHWSVTEHDSTLFPTGLEYWITANAISNSESESSLWTSSQSYPWQESPIIPTGFHVFVLSQPVVDIEKSGKSCSNEREGCVFDFSHSQATFVGKPARFTTAEFPQSELYGMNQSDVDPYSYYVFQNGDQQWIVAFTHDVDDVNDSEILDLLLNSFRLLDTGVAKSGQPICRPTYLVDQGGPELTAHQNYAAECFEQRNERDCLSVDRYDYRSDSFVKPDGVSDCEWTL